MKKPPSSAILIRFKGFIVFPLLVLANLSLPTARKLCAPSLLFAEPSQPYSTFSQALRQLAFTSRNLEAGQARSDRERANHD